MFLRISRLLIYIVFTLLLLEILLRLFGLGDPVLYIPDQSSGYRLLPEQEKFHLGHRVRISSIGTRGDEPIVEKKYIPFFGDSVTFGGSHLRDEETFVAIIDEKLRRTKYQALNAGVNNYGACNVEGLVSFLKGKIPFRDAVLVIPTVDFRRPFQSRFWRMGLEERFVFRVHYFVRVFQIITCGYFKKLTARSSQASSSRATQDVSQIIQNNIQCYRNALKSISRGIVFFVPSHEEMLEKVEDRAKPHFVKKLALEDSDLAIVDLYPILASYDMSMFRDTTHYNTKGHQILADVMWPFIETHFLSQGTVP